jgi:hypothetical protein
MGISWRNGARPRQTLEIRWTTSRVRRILGGPGQNRATDTRMSDSALDKYAYFIHSESTFLRFELSSPYAKFHKLSDVEY